MAIESRHNTQGDSLNEAKLTRLEEERQAALEVAQEEDAPPEAGSEDAQAVKLTPGGMG